MRLLTLSCLALIVGACGGSDRQVEATSDAVRQAEDGTACAAGAQARPYRGTCDTRFTITGPLLAGEQQIGFFLDITGTCRLTHLGLTQLEAKQVVLFLDDTTQHVENEATLTAANGDVLHSAFEGGGTPVVVDGNVVGFEFNGLDTLSSGTGRFASASGTADLVGSAWFDPPAEGAPPSTGSGRYEVSGTITY